MQYVVHCVNGGDFTTLTINAASERAVVEYLYTNVESAELPNCPISMQYYLQELRDYMEENGGCAIWDISCDGVQLEQFVNDYEYADTWDMAEANGHRYVTSTVNL